MPIAELAQRIGVSRRTASDRTRDLIQSGRVEIRGVVHPDLLGIHTFSYLSIATEGPARTIASAIADLPDVTFASLVTGAFPVAAEVRTGTSTDVADLVADIRGLRGVRTVETIRYVAVLRDVVGPVGDITLAVDAVDRRIMRILQDDGRIPYSELATRVGRSATATRQRLLDLIDGRAIHIGAVVRHGGSGQIIGVGVRVAGHDAGIVERLLAIPGLIFAARTLGRFDLVLTLRAASTQRLLTQVEHLRSWPEILSAEPWMHLDVVKESYAMPQAAPLAGTSGPIEQSPV